MSGSEKMEKLLESVAREVDFHCTEDDAHTYPVAKCKVAGECAALADEVVKVLKRRLLPLLEAGAKCALEAHEIVITDGHPRSIQLANIAEKAWDAALRAAQEQK